MSVKQKVARTITKLTGYEVRKPTVKPPARKGPDDNATVGLEVLREAPLPVTPETLAAARAANGDRLLTRPVFILSSVRSGSTLLRVILNSHSKLYAPHELHLREIKVTLRNKYVVSAMYELGSDAKELEYLLWDRILHRELIRHGKEFVVNKTPGDALMWRRVLACWPDARFIYLLRDPAAITDSWNRARSYWTRDETAADVLRYVSKVEEARQEVPGLTVRYEDFTVDPEAESRRICEFIGVDFEPTMLDYGDASHGAFKPGLGDWSSQIKTGKVLPSRPSTNDVPESLREITAAWGYVRAESSSR